VCGGCGCDRFIVESVPALCSATSGCSSVRSYRVFWKLMEAVVAQWNGCMIGVTFCCHVRRYMQVCHVMLQNAVYWLHECCMGLVLGRKPERKTLCFSV